MDQEMKYDTQFVSRDVYPCEVRIDKKIHTFAFVVSYNLWQNALATNEFEYEDYAEYYERQKDYTQLMLVGEQEMLFLLLPQPLDNLDCPFFVCMPEGNGIQSKGGFAEFLGNERHVELISAYFNESWESFQNDVEKAKLRRWRERKTAVVQQGHLIINEEGIKRLIREGSRETIEELQNDGMLPRKGNAKIGKNTSYSLVKRAEVCSRWRMFKDKGGTRYKTFIEENKEFCSGHRVENAKQLRLAIDSERKKVENRKKS